MRSALPAALALATLVLAGGFACSRKIYREPQAVSGAGGDTFWVAGSEGYGAFFDGVRFQVRDYPRTRGVPDWSYEPGNPDIPAARVVQLGGSAYLVTRVGDVMRWEGTQWERLPIEIPPEHFDHPQVDQVLVGPGGELLVQVHSSTLVRGTIEEFLDHRFRKETTPSYFTWLGYAGSALYGVGWDESGNVRALHGRQGSSPWRLLARLGHDRLFGEPKCVIALADGTQVVVTSYALLDTGADRRAQPFTTALPVLMPPVLAESQFSKPSNGPYVARCLTGEGRRALLLLGGTSADRSGNVLEVRAGEAMLWRCPSLSAWDVIGGVPRGEGWTLVTRTMQVVALPGQQCARVEGAGAVKTIAE